MKALYRWDAVAEQFCRDVALTIVGPTPTIYSRRQSPITLYLIRVLKEFGEDSFTYKQGRLRSVEIVDGVVVAKVGSEQDTVPVAVDGVVARQGLDYDPGVSRQIRPAESGVSIYAVYDNPIPGDDIRFPVSGIVFFGNENWSEKGYMEFLRTYFQTRVWKRVMRRGISLLDCQDSDEADLMATRIQWGGNTQDRAKAKKLFRTFKGAESRRARMRARHSLRLLDCDIGRRRREAFGDLMDQNDVDRTRRDDEILKLAIEKVRRS